MNKTKLIQIAEACMFEVHVLNRFNSLDAMQQAVLMQDEKFQWQFADKIFDKVPRYKWFHQLTYTDWQDAFVEVLEQRKEKK